MHQPGGIPQEKAPLPRVPASPPSLLEPPPAELGCTSAGTQSEHSEVCPSACVSPERITGRKETSGHSAFGPVIGDTRTVNPQTCGCRG